MKTTLRFFKALFPILLVLAGLSAAPQPARADLIDDFAWVLNQVPGVFPVSGSDIQQSRAFFNDLANVKTDTEVAQVLEKHKDSPLGKQASSAVGGIPSWFWDLIDTYIAFRTDDFWGVVAHMGEAAICIVAQVMTGGSVDVCGLIEELVKVGEALLDAATAVAEFFASAGEALWEGAKDVGCSLGLGGCGGSSPPEQRAYAWVFAPEVPAGLTARKSLDANAFPTLRSQLEKDASADPAKLHIQVMPGWIQEHYSAGVVQTASGVYQKAVDAQWSSDMATSVLPQLGTKRSGYDTPQQISILAAKAAAEYTKNPAVPPYTQVKNMCVDDFTKGYGFAHVDRWIAMYPGDAKGLGDVKSNPEWCQANVWPKNKDKFGQHFRAYAKANYCPEFGQTLLCSTVPKYQSCVGLLASVDLKDQCGINVGSMGKEAAEKIYAGMKAKGSKIPCQVKADPQILGTKPADLVCTRPTQGKACEDAYKNLYGTIPVKLVNCVVNETAAYKTLRGKVAAAVASLNQQYPNPPKGIPFGIDLVDPLLVHAPSADITGKVQAKNPSYGFGPPSAKPGFDYFAFQLPHTIDGVNTPALGVDTKLPKISEKVKIDNLQEQLELLKKGDPDPYGKLSSKTGVLTSSPAAAAAGAAQVQGAGQTKAMSGSLPPGSGPGAGKTGSGAVTLQQGASALAKAAPGGVSAPKGPDLGGAPAPKPTMGQAPGTGGRMASPASGGTADIKSGPRIVVAGKYTVNWGQGVTIQDADARRKANGICEVAVAHDAINSGSAASGPFGRRWVNAQTPAPFTDVYPSIPPGGSMPRTDTLSLKPGANPLTLTLDHMNQVKETNDADNIYRVAVTVNGTCGLPQNPPPIPPAQRLNPPRR